MSYVFNGGIDTDTINSNVAGTITVTDDVSITDATNSTSVVTGSLHTVGGVGITLDMFVGGDLTFPTNTGTNKITLPAGGNFIDMNDSTNNRIINLADPINPQEAATRNFVLAQAQGLNILDPSKVATINTTDILTVATYNGGANTITSTANEDINTRVGTVFDAGVTLVATDRILVKNAGGGDPSTNIANGIYSVTSVGSGATQWVITRVSELNLGDDAVNTFTLVEEGTTQGGNGYVQTEDPGIVNTDALTWTQFSQAGQTLASTLLKGNTTGATTIVISNDSSGIRSSMGTNPGDNGIELDVIAGMGNTTGAGGALTLTAGAGGSTSGTGGALTATSGDGGNPDGDSGALTLQVGSVGSATGAGSGGNVVLSAGDAGTGAGASGAGGDVSISAGDGGLASGVGGDVNITSGATTGADDAGDVNLVAALGAGAGDDGDIVFSARGNAPTLTFNDSGNVNLSGSYSATSVVGAFNEIASGGIAETLAQTLAAGNTTGANPIVINNNASGLQSSNGTGAVGFPINVSAGDGDTGFAGGLIALTGGDGTTTGDGGAITLTSGDGGATDGTTGGSAMIMAGTSTATNGNGGSAELTGGAGTGTGDGGTAMLVGGVAPGSGNAGSVSVVAGNANAGGTAGNATLSGGDSDTMAGNATVNAGDATGAGTGGTLALNGGDSVNGPAGSASLVAGSASGTGAGGGLTLTAGTASGAGAPGAVSITSGGTGGTTGGAISLTTGAGATNDGSITLNAGNANVNFDANNSGNIPVNSSSAGETTLDVSLPQNIVGAINALVGGIGPGQQRIAYQLVNLQVNVSSTSNTTLAFLPWIGGRYGSGGLNYTSGVIIFEASNITTDELIVEFVGTSGVLNSTATTSGDGFYTFSLDQNLPGVSNEQLFVRARKASSNNANAINVFGITVEWDTNP